MYIFRLNLSVGDLEGQKMYSDWLAVDSRARGSVTSSHRTDSAIIGCAIVGVNSKLQYSCGPRDLMGEAIDEIRDAINDRKIFEKLDAPALSPRDV